MDNETADAPTPISDAAGALAAAGARFDHVAHAVPSIADALPLYQGLLGGTPVVGGIAERNRHVAIQLDFDGGRIELLQPLPGHSPSVGNFLARNPRGGLHHLTFRVRDIHQALAALSAWGFSPFGTRTDDDDWKETFVHPRQTSGVLIQLVESHRPDDVGLAAPIDELLRRAADYPTTSPPDSNQQF